MSNLVKELLMLLGIFLLIAVVAFAARGGKKSNIEINGTKKEMDEPESTSNLKDKQTR
jgi:lipopolysaccharide export system protein LptA